jgi:hypothetical protein
VLASSGVEKEINDLAASSDAVDIGFVLGGFGREAAVDLGHEFKTEWWAPDGLGIAG